MVPDDTTPYRIAVVGVGARLPGADGPDQFWANILNRVDAARDVPPGRWLLDPAAAFAPGGPRPDKVYSRRGYFLDAIPLDLDGLDLDPDLVRRLDPVVHLLLHVGRRAWAEAVTAPLDRRRVGVIVGNIALPTERVSALSRELLGPQFSGGTPVSP